MPSIIGPNGGYHCQDLLLKTTKHKGLPGLLKSRALVTAKRGLEGRPQGSPPPHSTAPALTMMAIPVSPLAIPCAILALWNIYGRRGVWPISSRKHHNHKRAFFAPYLPNIVTRRTISCTGVRS